MWICQHVLLPVAWGHARKQARLRNWRLRAILASPSPSEIQNCKEPRQLSLGSHICISPPSQHKRRCNESKPFVRHQNVCFCNKKPHDRRRQALRTRPGPGVLRFLLSSELLLLLFFFFGGGGLVRSLDEGCSRTPCHCKATRVSFVASRHLESPKPVRVAFWTPDGQGSKFVLAHRCSFNTLCP